MPSEAHTLRVEEEANKTALGRYIKNLVHARSLSWRRASYQCPGLSPETIPMLIRRHAESGSKPDPDTLRSIATGLGGNYERMMILAGHLDEPSPETPAPEMRELFDRLLAVYRELQADPDALDQFIHAIAIQADALRAVARADCQAERIHERRPHIEKELA